MNAGSWQPDPTHRHELRWWDGNEWSDHVSDHGVAGIDALHPMATWSPPAASPTAPVISASPTGPPPVMPTMTIAATPPVAANGRRRSGVIAAGVLAVVGLGIGGVVLFGGDDEPSTGTATSQTLAVSSTVAPTGVPTSTATTAVVTTVAATTSTAPTTTVAVTTTFPGATVEQLVEAMPQADDVPASWFLATEPNVAPEASFGAGVGYCGGDNAMARALTVGADAAINGPSFDITAGGSFSVDAYAFPTSEGAAAFLQATEAQVSGCVTPATYEVPESEFDMFEPGYGDTATWSFVEFPTATHAVTNDADELLQITMDTAVSTTDGGYDYGLTITDQTWYEQHGRVVLVYNLYGWWGLTGFGDEGDPEWAFQPTLQAATDDSAVVRTQIVMRLTDMGLL